MLRLLTTSVSGIGDKNRNALKSVTVLTTTTIGNSVYENFNRRKNRMDNRRR